MQIPWKNVVTSDSTKHTWLEEVEFKELEQHKSVRIIANDINWIASAFINGWSFTKRNEIIIPILDILLFVDDIFLTLLMQTRAEYRYARFISVIERPI